MLMIRLSCRSNAHVLIQHDIATHGAYKLAPDAPATYRAVPLRSHLSLSSCPIRLLPNHRRRREPKTRRSISVCFPRGIRHSIRPCWTSVYIALVICIFRLHSTHSGFAQFRKGFATDAHLHFRWRRLSECFVDVRGRAYTVV
jgi:hypothetical protein